MGAGAPTVLSDWFMHADACKPQPGCGWCRGAMRAQMRRLSGCADSKGGGARAACSARGDAEMNAGRRVTRRRGNQVDEGVAQGHEQAERQVRRSYSSPPEGGEFDPPTPILRWAARCACGLRPAPRALLRVGRAAPRPPGLRPLVCPSAHGHPRPLSPSRRGFRARVRRWRGWASRRLVHARHLAPGLSPGFSFSKARQPERGQAAGLSTGGRQSLQRRRWADPGTARRAAVHLGWAAGLSTARAGHRAQRQRHPVPARRRRSALCKRSHRGKRLETHASAQVTYHQL